MNCPACGASVPGGHERCSGCGAHVAPLTEGALAPDPAARPRPEPLREIPGLKKRERTWKDEVRERMRDRKRRRGDGDLPLFRDGDEADDVGDEEAMAEAPPPDETPAAPFRPPIVLADPPPRGLARTPDLGLGSTPIDIAGEADLPLRAPDLPLRSPTPPVATRTIRSVRSGY